MFWFDIGMRIALGFNYLTQSHDEQDKIIWIKPPMSLVPTHIYPRFDGTQTRLGPLKLGAIYFGNALVWIAGCFVIATNEVPLTSFLSIIFASIEIGLELLPKGHE